MIEHNNPYWGIDRRLHPKLEKPGTNIQQELDDPDVAQQPNFDSSYLSGFTMKWKEKQKLRLATVLRTNERGSVDPTCIITLLNSNKELKVPIKDFPPCTTNDPADITTYAKDINSNAIESLLTHEDLEKLWHKDQVTISDDIRIHLYWYQRL
eukprot:2313144-Ditylum_brightwellii.AAC.1